MKKAFIPVLLLALLVLSACGGNENSALVPFSSSNYQGENYQNVISELQDAGFTNITTDTMLTYSNGKVDTVGTVTIDGDHLFRKSDRYNKDVPVVVSYYYQAEPEPSQEVEPTDPPEPVSSSDTLSLGDIDLALRTSLYAGFGDNYTLTTDGLTYTATVWGDGVAMNATLASLGDAENLEVWNSLVDSTLSAAENFQSILNNGGHSDMVFIIQVANDMNESRDTVLLSVSLGTVLYDYVNGIDLIG